MRLNVVALVLDGVELFDLATANLVFADSRGAYTFATCAAQPGPVRSAGGLVITVEHGLDLLEHADTIVIPGYEPHVRPGADVESALRRAAARGARLASICTGAFALAAAGLLDGRAATTHWQDCDELAGRHPKIQVDHRSLYLGDGHVYTSAGVCAGIDLCLHLVRQDHGVRIATDIARRMVTPPHRLGGQAQYVPPPAVERTDSLAAVCDWALAHLDEPLSLTSLAKQAQWSARTLARKFHDELGISPMAWVAAQRLSVARHLLEATDDPIETVARSSGLGTAVNLRKTFHRDMAVTPGQYRRTFRGEAHTDNRKVSGDPTPTSCMVMSGPASSNRLSTIGHIPRQPAVSGERESTHR